jgi:drug/metabolite transporter (DMT)-like permease
MTATTAAPIRSAAMAGIGFMLGGIFLFALNDALGKFLISTYSVGQLLLVRSAAALILLAPFIWREGADAYHRAPRPPVQWLRALFATLELACFYWALAYMPLADVMTYYLASPIYVTAMSPFLLGERVGWRRWSAVAVGFLGVLIALKPSSGALNYHALVAFTGSMLYAFFLVVTRRLREAPDLTLAAWQMVGTLIAGALVAPFSWRPFASAHDIPLLALLGVTALVAIVAVNRSLRLAPASVVVPYQYTLIVWAVLFGYFVFGDVPSWRVVVGAAIIVAAGLFIFFREQTVAEEPVPQVAPGP